METYGELGIDEDGEPMVMSAEEAFRIIADDFCPWCGAKMDAKGEEQ